MHILMIGTTELILIVVVCLLIFGGKKIPELMKGIGKGMRSLRAGLNEPSEEEIAANAEREDQLKRAEIEREERIRFEERIRAEERAKIEAEMMAKNNEHREE